MAVTYIILLSCIVYGTLASPPASSYLPPSGGASAGRPSGPAPVARPTGGALGSRPSGPALVARATGGGSGGRPAVQGPGASAQSVNLPAPSSSYLPPSRGRPAVPAPVVSGRAASGPAATSLPISAGRQHGGYRVSTPTASGYGPRTVGPKAPY